MKYSLGSLVQLYLATTVIFFGIDMVWLGLVARNQYVKWIGHLMTDSPNWTAAILFYLLFIVGVIFFAVLPAWEAKSIWRAVALGAAFGFFTYMTYDLTNLATLKDWPIAMVVVDIIWGSVLSASVAAGSWYVAKWIL
jgi:uncharacterized membrane protein